MEQTTVKEIKKKRVQLSQSELIIVRAASLHKGISRIPWSEIDAAKFPVFESLYKDLGKFLTSTKK